MIAECPNQIELKLWDAAIPLLQKGKKVQKAIAHLSETAISQQKRIQIGIVLAGIFLGLLTGIVTFC